MIRKIIGQLKETRMQPMGPTPEENQSSEEIEPKKIIEKDEDLNLFPEFKNPVEDIPQQIISQLPLKKPKGFQPGFSGNKNGRKKGTLNAKTKIIKLFTEDVLAENALQFRKNLKILGRKNPKQHVDAIIALMEYMIPKQNRIEFEDQSKNEDKPREVFLIGGKTFEW